MIKVENDMLVLDNTFTKEDVQAIDEFVKINVDRERERIIKLLENELWHNMGFGSTKLNQPITKPIHLSGCLGCEQIALIKNFGE
jgi:hypothetical protein